MGVAAGAAMAAAMPTVVLAGEAQAGEQAQPAVTSADENDFEYAQEQAALGPITEDPERYLERGATTLTVNELNRIRHQLVDAAGDLELADGTVIPALWHKLDVLVNTYGMRGADPETGEGIPFLQYLFDNDEQAVAHYLEMPFGRVFSEYEYAEESGLEVEECKAILEDLAQRGLLYRANRAGGPVYHHLAIAHGFFEQSIPRMYDPGFINAMYTSYLGAPSMPMQNALCGATPIYYAIPCDEQVVGDERVLPLNDYREIVERNDTIAILPCCCSLREDMRLYGDVPPIGSEEMKEYRNGFDAGHNLERCMGFGEEAEYYLSIGAARQITKEEAYEILARGVDEGLVLQCGYTRNSEFICQCHPDCCGVLGLYSAFGQESWDASPIRFNVSNYMLAYDADTCIKCGACVTRCPMSAISMEDGIPTITGMCVRCGQCGLVCPVGARKLTARPANDRLPVPLDRMDDHNRKFGWRVEHGMHGDVAL